MPSDTTVMGLPTDSPVLVLLVMACAVLVALLVRRRGRPGARGGSPRPGDIWFADVPFEDGTGSKDRPVLVLHVTGRTCEVARFTSQNRSARRDHVRLPPGFPGLTRTSWIDLRPRTLEVRALRRRAGHPGPALVAWYRDASQQRDVRGRSA